MWCWWHERNKGDHGERRLPVQEFQVNVRRHVDEWLEFLKPEQADAARLLLHRSWVKPSQEFVKINIDASFIEEAVGWGIICRDDTPTTMFATAGRLNSLSDALRAEAEALLNAILVADRLGVGRAIFETDCLILKQAVSSDAYDQAPLGIFFCDIKYKLCTLFIEARLIHAASGCNQPSHALAALGAGLDNGDHVEWFSDYPQVVAQAVTGDLPV